MDEEIKIIDSNTRNEKIKNFFINNKKHLIISFSVIFIVIIGFFSMQEISKQKKFQNIDKMVSSTLF